MFGVYSYIHRGGLCIDDESNNNMVSNQINQNENALMAVSVTHFRTIKQSGKFLSVPNSNNITIEKYSFTSSTLIELG